MIAIIWQVALLLVLAFLIGLLLILNRKPRSHDEYHSSPTSRSTPLGYYSAQQDRRVAHGVPGMRAYQAGDEGVDTVKVSTPEGKR